jgi:signal transduction histidine kinase
VAQPPAFLSRPAVTDAAPAVLLAALCLVPGLADKGLALGELSPARPVGALGVALTLAQCLPSAVRRKWPTPAFAVIAPAFAIHQLAGYPVTVASLGLLIALYGIGGRRIPGLAAVAGYALLAIGLHLRGSPERWFDFLTFAVVLGACWLLGDRVRDRRSREVTRRRAEAGAAVADERARIARELHDVVTHHVTAMVVQADAAQFQTEPAAGLESISDTGRQALAELRHLLGVLNAPAAAGREPVTGRLSDLVERVRAAGQPVEYVQTGAPGLLAGGAELAAYRVVQEGLTNAMKHAAGRTTIVTVAYGEAGTDIAVLTDGPVAPHTDGYGLVGLRERVAVFGGELRAGPRPEGGFALQARIPA